ncbi:hypothetical protein J6590_031815 [Homalodisca vitripennis]|nr:hypothetical protein J6590_031815 [Homalodisca vitripennis]
MAIPKRRCEGCGGEEGGSPSVGCPPPSLAPPHRRCSLVIPAESYLILTGRDILQRPAEQTSLHRWAEPAKLDLLKREPEGEVSF